MARLAFFGTPEFSLPSLMAVHRFCQHFGHELILVVSQTDKMQGRGQRLLAPPVKEMANRLQIDVVQPASLRKGTLDGDQFYDHFLQLRIDLAVVVAYGKLITERLLKACAKGFVNVHGSLLPRFRGAAPVQRAIEAGDQETGVCLMAMVKKLDEGDIYICKNTPIIPSDTSATLLRRLANMGATLLYRHLEDILQGKMLTKPQASEGITYAHMLTKDEGLLDFSLPAKTISCKVKALDPWPCVYGFINDKRVKFFDSFYIKDSEAKKHIIPGTVVANHPFLGVKTIDGIVYFQSIQLEGKRAMPVKDALLGFPVSIGQVISQTYLNKLV